VGIGDPQGYIVRHSLWPAVAHHAQVTRRPIIGLLAILILPWLLFRYDELRPQVFSFIGVVLVYMNMRSALEKLRSGAIRPGALIALPFIMLLWANLHPGYMLGWVIIIVMLAGVAFDQWRGVIEWSSAHCGACSCGVPLR